MLCRCKVLENVSWAGIMSEAIDIRILGDSDHPKLEAFLIGHRDSSMFLRSNALRVGLVYRDAPFHALYAGVFDDGNLIGVIAHAWSGMVLLQCPGNLDELAQRCIAWSGRKVTGFAGPADQVRRAQIALHVADAPSKMAEEESLYALDLTELKVPTALKTGEIVCRAPLPEERNLLCSWRSAYDIETLGSTDSEETRNRAAAALDHQIAERNAWIAIRNSEPVSLSAFNASLADIVQLGGIYTPPEHRGRGYAKASVAASLIAARERGASRAVLFTSNPSAARSYEAVGFRRLGDYGLVLLK
jgi:predicted GNAT family acetyltransferase